jgi:hypothetical protein
MFGVSVCLRPPTFKLAALEGFGLNIDGHIPFVDFENRQASSGHLKLGSGAIAAPAPRTRFLKASALQVTAVACGGTLCDIGRPAFRKRMGAAFHKGVSSIEQLSMMTAEVQWIAPRKAHSRLSYLVPMARRL